MKPPASSLPDAYPLQWPLGWPRTKVPRDSAYNVSERRARDDLLEEVRLLGGKLTIISSNIPSNTYGKPYLNAPTPDDAGVAVYWVREGKQEVMACDRWKKPWENMRAIYYAVAGLRQMERAGATQIMERAFEAFRLPAPAEARPSWRDVLGTAVRTKKDASAAFRDRATKLHPDVGGDIEAFRQLERAYSDALAELRE